MSLLVSAFLICLAASGVGAVCGIGGGVIIKPVLDALGIMSVQQASFLSGCTVLCMAAYSVLSSRPRLFAGAEEPGSGVTLPMALGAAVGGVCGKLLFQQLSRGASLAGLAQSVCLLALTLGTFLYTLFQRRIRTHRLHGRVLCGLIGLLLGVFSSFLGIGGGPINLVLLSFLFSMDVKTAAENSLFIILVSQIASLLFSLLTRSVPDVSPVMLLAMALGGVGGGVLGRLVNKRISAEGVRRLFLGVNLLIVGVCLYNIIRAAS